MLTHTLAPLLEPLLQCRVTAVDSSNAARCTRRGRGLSLSTVRLAWQDGTLALDGDVWTLRAKRRALAVAARYPGVSSIIDRLRVTPATWMCDATIGQHVAESFMDDSTFCDCTIRRNVGGTIETMQERGGARGEICVRVDGGVVTLEGMLPTRSQQRLAGVLSWWVPGTRDVVPALGGLPSEEDEDDAVTAAVISALDKDPSVDATQVRVRTRSNVVTLSGLVWSEAERSQAENDAWYVFQVADVVNELTVALLG
jgi:osmotically-inducible protein OsmY